MGALTQLLQLAMAVAESFCRRPRCVTVSTQDSESSDHVPKPSEASVHATLPLIGVNSPCRALSAAMRRKLSVTSPMRHAQQLRESISPARH